MFISCKKKIENPLELKCENAKDKAKEDFKNQKYIWTNFSGLDFDFGAGDEEFAKLLQSRNIEYKLVGLSCIEVEGDQFENCYEIEMNNLLKHRFGKNFFDSLQIVGKKEFYIKHKDSIDGNNHN